MTARTSIHVVRVSLAILTCALVTQPALADPDYLPLQVGNTWSYEGSGGYAETMTVIGTTEVLGEVVSVIDYSASTSNEPLENYWTRASDGDVMLWGFFRDEEGGWGLAYDPPIRWVDVPAVVGATWACTTQVYALPGEIPEGEMVLEYTVWWGGVLSPPAGSFQAIGIGFADPWELGTKLRGYAPDGRVLGARSEPSRWLSDGVGLVQYDYDALYELVSFGTTPVDVATWARVKLLYR
jgi:hypothetical protein